MESTQKLLIQQMQEQQKAAAEREFKLLERADAQTKYSNERWEKVGERNQELRAKIDALQNKLETLQNNLVIMNADQKSMLLLLGLRKEDKKSARLGSLRDVVSLVQLPSVRSLALHAAWRIYLYAGDAGYQLQREESQSPRNRAQGLSQ